MKNKEAIKIINLRINENNKKLFHSRVKKIFDSKMGVCAIGCLFGSSLNCLSSELSFKVIGGTIVAISMGFATVDTINAIQRDYDARNIKLKIDKLKELKKEIKSKGEISDSKLNVRIREI